MKEKEHMESEAAPVDDLGCISPNDRREDDEYEYPDDDRDPNLDPGFSSWQDLYNYMYY